MDPECPFDFTPCFEDIVVKAIPVALLVLFGVPRLFSLLRRSSLCYPSRQWRQVLKLAGIGVVAVASAVLLEQEQFWNTDNRSDRVSLELVISAMEMAALPLAFVLTVVENQKSYRSSNVLLLFWLLLLVSSLIKLRTLTLGCAPKIALGSLSTFASPHDDDHGQRRDPQKRVGFLGVKALGILFVFILECLHKDSGIQLGENDDFEKCPEDEANVFSIVSFHWVSGLMRKGYAKPLTMSDLWALRKQDQSTNVSGMFERAWKKQLEKEKPSLFRAIVDAYGGPFYVAGAWKFVNDILGFAQPILLREMLRFVMSYKTSDPQPLYRGYFIATLMFVCGITQTTVLHQYFHLCLRTGMYARAGIVTAVYQKSLRLSNTARQEFTVGEIVNHMSIDAQKIQDLVTYLHVIWSGLFQISIALFLLYDTMGWAIFAGVAVMLLSIPINARIMMIVRGLQRAQMSSKDTRIKYMNEILNGIRVIKLYAWEGTFLQRILTIRNEYELAVMKRIGYLGAAQTFTWACTPFLVSLSTFTVYSLVMKKPMTTDIVFTAISLFNLLSFPLSMFPFVISACIEANVAIDRVYKFLVSSEVDPNAIIIEDHLHSQAGPTNASDKYALLVKDATYSWNKSSQAVIKDISFALKKNALLSIIGRVGSGKSSLIAALCGDLERVSGEIRIRGTVAFVPQQAWIMNDTLRNNIVFGNTYDPEYYQKTVEACCLLPDFEMLPGGDMTEIGERGINLSGGQKARISLARAVYAQADIYLLDDPLSAVDAHVGRAIFDKVIGPGGLLSGKARLLVTHQLQYLAQSTSIIMLKEGRVVEQGSFQELQTRRSDTYQLFAEFVREARENNEISSELATDSVEDVIEQSSLQSQPTSPRSVQRGESIPSLNSVRTRRNSEAPAPLPKNSEDENKNKNIIVEEEMKQGSVDWRVYLAYAKACSVSGVIIFFTAGVLSQGSLIMTSLWLTHWSSDNDLGKRDHSSLYYVSVYAAIGLVYAVLVVFQSIQLSVRCGIRSSRVLHQEMLQSVLRSPMSFFDTTPMGRILNRFSKDQSTIDEVLPRSFAGYIRTLFSVASILVVVTISTPSFVVVIFPFSLAYLWLQRYYLATSRELRRLDSVTRSPIYAHFQETIGGISSIRAYRQQERFIKGNEYRLDQNQRAYYPSIAGNRWLAFRIECLSSLIIFGAAFLSVVSLSRDVSVDPGLVGLSLTYALSITQTLNWMIRQYTEIESNIVSVERVQEYIELESEAPEIIDDYRPPQEWPAQGRVEFVGYETRYRPGLELVLRGVNCSILPHEKIGICGRTGAGKSSLTLSLFRIIESVRGQIFVDGIDISDLGLYDVRSRFTIIPQDPVLFLGTVRFNLDPMGVKSDLELWQALEDSYLKDYVSTLEGGLNAAVLEQGENFSVGQRQLICLARALLRKTSLLVLDEATAAIDLETDALVQKVIRQKFNDCTILTIAHRINTVMDNDRIMVLDQGQVAEFDTPAKLLADPTSMFYSLAKESGNA
ncbi:hypothetical protein BGW38_010208 [Lunasporangiospora selenospora]|uniref:Uncharacterized protein n=1 Tax=Lunasporangiospora selenospora TaxID=979761 RepID=A0A9P6KFU5_9FUNG|nr:hypothetical protein BGW38_010208 [Lunasporangiospora selenospora]